MILQELAGYYRRKAASDTNSIAPEGWIRRPVDYFVVLSREGHCIDIADNARQEGKRRVAADELVPSIGKQSLKHTNSGKDANLLWDNAAFTLGYGDKSEQKQACFLAEVDHWFPDVGDEALAALRVFLLSMREEGAVTGLLNRFGLREAFEKREPVIAFRWQPDGVVPIHHRPGLMKLYEYRRTRLNKDAVLGSCLISGDRNVPIAINETVIKGVRDAQTSGANIVSFNKRAVSHA
jgi:CRISPR-associated protein Csd1